VLNNSDAIRAETPATRATSRMLGDRGGCARVVDIVALSRSGQRHAHVHVHIPSQIIMHGPWVGAS
jgi:hypothetical protein